MWIQKFEQKKSIVEIELKLNNVLQLLSNQYPSVSKTAASLNIQVEFPIFHEIKMNLFNELAYFESYDIVVVQIQKINLKARYDFTPFKYFLYTIQKDFQGSHAKVGMKSSEKKQSMTHSQKLRYKYLLFKVLMRIFQKMIQQIVKIKQEILQTIKDRLEIGKTLPLYSVNQIIMNTWIQYIKKILADRKEKRIKTECQITDLVRGRCIMFSSIPAIQNAVNGVINIYKERNYEIIQLDNRILKVTQDVVIQFKIKEVVSEVQLALQFDTAAFEFGHSFQQILRCPLGSIFGSSLFLTKDTSENFFSQVSNSIKSLKTLRPNNKQNLDSLQFVMDSFKKSSKILPS